MAKRKRGTALADNATKEEPRKAVKATSETNSSTPIESSHPVTVQIITGSYERVLHGFTASLLTRPQENGGAASIKNLNAIVEFSDTFLFEAHASAIRCLAISPINQAESTQNQKLILASGGTDERINLYELSAAPPVINDQFPSVSTLAGNNVIENPRNRELGSLLHHSSTITDLCFPSRSKLLASAEDNTISVTKTRDWTVVSTIKAPRPKMQGRPSGDTAPPGDAPSGITSFAVHQSMKLMLSVGRGEKCMRLWNLVTGKKAGVLNFGRDLLESAGEGKWGLGEGRQIVWDSRGEEFAVAFERGVVVFGIDSIPKYRVVPAPPTKIHRIRYCSFRTKRESSLELLAISTEDGRIIFYSTTATEPLSSDNKASSIPKACAYAEVGGKLSGVTNRVKDFEILSLDDHPSHNNMALIVACGSDGAVRVWSIDVKAFENQESAAAASRQGSKMTPLPQAGKLLGTYETGNRITCMVAFLMQKPEDPAMMSDSGLDGDEGNEIDGESSSEEPEE